MPEMTLHEQVARIMARSQSVGHVPYNQILDALKNHFPTERELRAEMDRNEAQVRKIWPDYPGLIEADRLARGRVN